MNRILVIVGSFILSACSTGISEANKECYTQAVWKHNIVSDELLEGTMEKFWSYQDLLTEAHYDGRLLHIPLMSNDGLIYGGTCAQTKVWNEKLSEDFRIKSATEEEYDKVYNKARGLKLR